MQHPWERNRFPYMLQSADPRDRSLDAHAEATVWNAAVLAQVKIPLEGLFRQIVLVDTLQQQFMRGHALRSADDFAVAFGSQHVYTERQFRALWIGFHIECLHAGWIAMHHDRLVIL